MTDDCSTAITHSHFTYWFTGQPIENDTISAATWFVQCGSYAATVTSLCKLTLGHVTYHKYKFPTFYIDGMCDDTDISAKHEFDLCSARSVKHYFP